VHGKSNFGELGASQAFRLSKAGGFEWLGESDVTLDELLSHKSGGGRGSKMEKAKAFILGELSGGVVVPADDMVDKAKLAGISEITLMRAKAVVKAKSIKAGEQWVWSL
jgi:hypothetical protein